MKATLALAAVLSGLSLVRGQAAENPGFVGTGSASFYWHNRYHGLLAMSGYADPAALCPLSFTNATLQLNYPGSTEPTFTVLSTWGPTPKYGLRGYNVKVPEMNKVVMVFLDVYGWQNFNATLVPLNGVGCDGRCYAHAGAIEAFEEAQAATNDWEAIKSNQDDKVWSSSGHGFGGMVSQIASLSLKYRGFSYSSQTFGSPPVFNDAAAARYNDLFQGDASQRTISHDDVIPTLIPLGDYVFVDTGIHVFGTNPMYGQDYVVCDNAQDTRCHGTTAANGGTEADHWFYYTEAGTCGGAGYTASFNETREQTYLNGVNTSYYATATGAILSTPVTSIVPATSTTSAVLEQNTTVTVTGSTGAPTTGTAAPAQTSATTTGAASTLGMSLAALVAAGFAVVVRL